MLFRDFELEDLLDEFRFDVRDILRRRNIENNVDTIKIELGLGLRRFLLRRALDIEDLEDLIEEIEEREFPERFREREVQASRRDRDR
ncbi:MAG: hypothetical protein HYX84_05400 [Chloroflexi bacterium]|nr:hypothetical protein [Chloroflexota bacterium]